MAIYPPILASSQDAFLASISTEPIYFSLSGVTKFEDIKHVQIKVVYQSNSQTAVSTSIYPDGIIYKPASAISDWGNNKYSISILSSDLKEGWWKANKYYKVQICFGENALWSGDISNFATWKAAQVEQNAFSDWSTVMVLKAIAQPEIKIANKGSVQSGGGDLIIESAIDTELTTTPLFQGYFKCEGEAEDQYQFVLYDSDYNLIESTGWLQRTSSGGTDNHRFKTILENTKQYIVSYEVITINGYHAIAKNYEFNVNENFLTKLEGISLLVSPYLDETIKEPYGDENGVLNIFLTTEHPISGNYVITRSSEKSNYSVWEDLKFISFTNEILNHSLIFQDFTIESGIKYKYAFQQENMVGLRTAPLYEQETMINSPERLVNFQHSYFFRDGIQLKLKLDHKLSSFKYTVLANKQDTLGSKYPTINRNGDAYYAEFPLTGTISLHGDDYLTFFEKRNDGYYYKGEKVISNDKYDKNATYEAREEFPTPVKGQENKYPDIYERAIYNTTVDTYDMNLTDDNFFIERIYREKVEEFLNDGNPKLYKSPSEGNIVVALMNVSMTPNTTLGRMIFSFSATAYEVMDDILTNLDEYGIINIGSVEELTSSIKDINEDILIGQIAGLFEAGTNLIDLIKQQNEYDIGGGYKYSFLGINSIQVESYPKVDLSAELNELQIKYINAASNEDEDLMVSLQDQITTLQKLQEALDNQISYPVITLFINSKEVSLGPNKIYQLKDSEQVTSLSLKYTQPIIINYSCSVMSKESEAETVSAVITSSVWGQVAGVFTTPDSPVLDNYKLARESGQFEVSSLADYNFALYQSLDISQIVEEHVRRQIENLYKTKFYYDKDIKGWTDGRIRYIFQKFKNIEIEADEGTTLKIVNQNNPIPQEVIIGRTNKFRLQETGDIAKDISLKEPAFAIVNYRCLTMQMQMGGK